ncbi:hypothetical protein Lepto7375DRAFT_3505 [Leptolyngbya sp. PCC 7375]|nr:hypothetical protein Lepto7375DRAFT_3505 [Leptolyngbya sp. PCC 7375]
MRNQTEFTSIMGLLLFLAALQPAQGKTEFGYEERPYSTVSVEERAIKLSKVLHERQQHGEKTEAPSPKDRWTKCADWEDTTDTTSSDDSAQEPEKPCVSNNDDDWNDWGPWDDWNDWNNWSNWADANSPRPKNLKVGR